jgi:hypothetical protein
MDSQVAWTFVDGDLPGDGAMWLEHASLMPGWIDFIDRATGSERRIMVVAKSFVALTIADVGSKARSTSFAAMLVIPDGTPAQMRASIDDAVATGALTFVLADPTRTDLTPPAV